MSKKKIKAVPESKDIQVQFKKNRDDEVSGFTIRQLKQLNQWLAMAVGDGGLGSKAHYWAQYYIGKMRPILKAFDNTVQAHKEHNAYITAVRAPNSVREAVDRQFADYLSELDGLLGEEADISIRKFKAEWCVAGKASGPLSAALIEFDLMDDNEKLLDIVYDDKR